MWKEISSNAERGCLQYLCEASNSIRKLSIMSGTKQICRGETSVMTPICGVQLNDGRC